MWSLVTGHHVHAHLLCFHLHRKRPRLIDEPIPGWKIKSAAAHNIIESEWQTGSITP